MPRKQGAPRRATKPQYYPLDPAMMSRVCRQMAQDMRAEAAADWPPIGMVNGDRIDRRRAAWLMDEQASRWEKEAATGEPNTVDREKM